MSSDLLSRYLLDKNTAQSPIEGSGGSETSKFQVPVVFAHRCDTISLSSCSDYSEFAHSLHVKLRGSNGRLNSNYGHTRYAQDVTGISSNRLHANQSPRSAEILSLPCHPPSPHRQVHPRPKASEPMDSHAHRRSCT